MSNFMFRKVNFKLIGNKITMDKDIPKKGVYLLVNTVSNKLYVGESSFISRRLKQHIRTQYSDNLVCNKYLVNSIRKYNINNFKIFIVCEEQDDYKRILIENRLISEYRVLFKYDMVYNIRNKSDSNLGINVGDEHPFSVKKSVKKDIINDYNTGEYLIVDLSVKYNISVFTISKIVGGCNKTILKKHKSGEKNNTSKLTSDDVKNILKEFFYDKIKINTLSKKYGVGRSVIQNVINNLTYKNVDLSQDLMDLRYNYGILSTKDKKSYNNLTNRNPNSRLNKNDVFIIKNKWLNSTNKSVNNLTKKLCEVDGLCFSRGTITKIIKGERDYLLK